VSADFADFGKYLTQQRELRGLSREDVSGSTRIPLALVGALEEGELDRLPARVFVKNYIRAYAEEIGLSPDEAVLRFEEIEQELSPAPEEPLELPARRGPTAASPAAKAGKAKVAWVGIGVLLLAVLAGLWAAGLLPLPHR
jgi:cytoskeletal protein RodZ